MNLSFNLGFNVTLNFGFNLRFNLSFNLGFNCNWIGFYVSLKFDLNLIWIWSVLELDLNWTWIGIGFQFDFSLICIPMTSWNQSYTNGYISLIRFRKIAILSRQNHFKWLNTSFQSRIRDFKSANDLAQFYYRMMRMAMCLRHLTVLVGQWPQAEKGFSYLKLSWKTIRRTDLYYNHLQLKVT